MNQEIKESAMACFYCPSRVRLLIVFTVTALSSAQALSYEYYLRIGIPGIQAQGFQSDYTDSERLDAWEQFADDYIDPSWHDPTWEDIDWRYEGITFLPEEDYPKSDFTDTGWYNIDFGYNDISEATGLLSITGSPRLTLRIGQNNLSHIETLSNLSQAHTLDISSNNISDITPISGLHGPMNTLALDDNQIEDISPLANVSEVGWQFKIDQNQITDLGPLSSMSHIERLSIYSNPIEDLTPLSEFSEMDSIYTDERVYTTRMPMDSPLCQAIADGTTTHYIGNPNGPNSTGDAEINQLCE